MRIVIDTNVVVSGIFFGGKPAELLKLVLNHELSTVATQEILDEYQDTNYAQYMLVRLLAAQSRNLFMVGDDDQSIYGFRGANPELMFSFSSYYPEIKQIQLQENYRCEQKILEASQHLISHNEKRFFKEINGIKAEEVV